MKEWSPISKAFNKELSDSNNSCIEKIKSKLIKHKFHHKGKKVVTFEEQVAIKIKTRKTQKTENKTKD